MRFPPQLKPGGTVALVATSSPAAHTQAAQKVADSVAALEALGYRVWQAPSLHASTCKGYAAAPAALRAEGVNQAFADPSVDAVWCIRGGSTAMEILPLLAYETIAVNPKPFIGFSDATALHVALHERCGFVTYHGPVAKNLTEEPAVFTLESLFSTLAMEEDRLVQNPEGEPIRTLHGGRAEGLLVGGNLSLVSALVGTPYALDTKDKILFLEDVGEQVYRLDRMLTQLKYSGALDAAAGLVFGDFKNCRNSYNESFGAEEMLREFFADYEKPVIYNLKAGHCQPVVTLPLGCRCALDADRASLILYKD